MDIRIEGVACRSLRVGDLSKGVLVKTIAFCRLESVGVIGKETARPVLYFQDGKGRLVLNVTNREVLTEAFGFETDDWRGHEVHIYPAPVQFRRWSTHQLRVAAPVQSRSPTGDLEPARP